MKPDCNYHEPEGQANVIRTQIDMAPMAMVFLRH